MTALTDVPAVAAWRFVGEHAGSEVAWFTVEPDGVSIAGAANAVVDGEPWSVSYELRLDGAWATRWVRVRTRSRAGGAQLELVRDDASTWSVNGHPAPELAGCLDVDLEGSVVTNVFPIRRHDTDGVRRFDAPAAYVRASGAVERIEQHYTRRPDRDGRRRYDYDAPAFGVACLITFDASGLVIDYPNLAKRVAVRAASAPA